MAFHKMVGWHEVCFLPFIVLFVLSIWLFPSFWPIKVQRDDSFLTNFARVIVLDTKHSYTSELVVSNPPTAFESWQSTDNTQPLVIQIKGCHSCLTNVAGVMILDNWYKFSASDNLFGSQATCFHLFLKARYFSCHKDLESVVHSDDYFFETGLMFWCHNNIWMNACCLSYGWYYFTLIFLYTNIFMNVQLCK